MITAPELCERLAALLRAGHGPRAALVRMPDQLADPPDAVMRASRLAALGLPLDSCIQPLRDHFGDDLDPLVLSFASMGPTGSNSARLLDRLAHVVRERTAARRDGEVAAAGATLSARTIAALPLMTIPVALRQLDDPIVVVALGAGIALWVAGYRWLLRVIPAPEPDPPGAVMAEAVAAALDQGQSLDGALRQGAAGSALIRKVRLGASWRTALAAERPGLARSVADAQAMGLAIADALTRFAEEERRSAAQRFQESVGRAPVKMVVPLVCCVLPSFVLVGVVPLLRGLSLSG